jgi:DNA-binding NtrC family response regulator
MERPLALVVDGDPATRQLARQVLGETGFDTVDAGSGPEAMEVLRTRPVVLLLADLRAPGISASDLPREAMRLRPTLVPVVLADRSDLDTIGVVGEGAFDVVGKPIHGERLRVVARRAATQHGLMEELVRLREERGRDGSDRLVGRSAAMDRVRETLSRLASSEGPVLLVGEEGVGKELAARTLHALSARRERPLVAADVGAVPRERIGSELFDEASGALGMAGAGSLFLAGVDGLSLEHQDRLLRVLQAGSPDVRVLVATGRDLERLAREGAFRPELLRRLAGRTVEIPPLRARPEDVAPLALHFVEAIRELNNLGPLHLAPEALSALQSHPWPGNVRELRHAVEQAVILANDGVIELRDLPDSVRRAAAPATAEPGQRVEARDKFRDMKRGVVEVFEKAYLDDLLARHGGNVTAAAQHAGMLRSALQRLLRKYDLRSADYRRPRRRVDAAEGS